jgi:hypothetical protein
MKLTQRIGALAETRAAWIAAVLLALALFWAVLWSGIPYAFSRWFFAYSAPLFVLVLAAYWLAFRLKGAYGALARLGLTMLLLSLALHYKWTSGFSDNGVIGGLLPYKDGKNYYYGASLILNGFPLTGALQATERPLSPGLMASLLIFTGRNLQLVLAMLVQLAGLGMYVAARPVARSLGALPAGLYSTLMFFYFQPFVGFALSELTGFTLGCLAFAILWHAAAPLRSAHLALGALILIAAVSARAGAFLVFPLLILWAGRAYRGPRRFSIRAALIAAGGLLAGYVLLNSAYPRLLDVPPGSAFSNFSYALYGQVRGGTGWHSAIAELGTRDPGIVYRAALEFFLQHPFSLLLAIAKSYRDFFQPSEPGILSFAAYGGLGFTGLLVWAGTMLLLIRGLIRTLGAPGSGTGLLILGCFAGILLSIPFLPPVDGGPRFYASTMAFFFAMPAIGAAPRDAWPETEAPAAGAAELRLLHSAALVLLAMMTALPAAYYRLAAAAAGEPAVCPPEQNAFVIRTDPGAYIDVLPEGVGACGRAPAVCRADFESNGTEKGIDDFYQWLLDGSGSSPGGIRIRPAVNLLDGEFHYFVESDPARFDDPPGGRISGCATEIRTRNQSIYQVE